MIKVTTDLATKAKIKVIHNMNLPEDHQTLQEDR